MKAIVKAHKTTGKVVTRAIGKDSGKEYGTIMVQQTVLVTENNFLVPRNRAAFIRIANEHLDAMEAILTAGMEYPSPGRIQRIESLTERYPGQSPKVIPANKDKGTEEAPYFLNGQSVYFTDEWNSDVNCQDTLLVAEVAETVSDDVSAEAQA